MTWKEELQSALENLGGEAPLFEIYAYIEQHTDRVLPDSWKAVIRGIIERCSSDSAAYDGQENLFYSAKGLGEGIWGLNNFIPTQSNMDLTQDDAQFSEGRQSLKMHIARERNHKVITLAKEKRLQDCGELRCEICGFNFKEHYGDIGFNFIEAHHIKPVSQLKTNEKTRIEDIVLLCSNCHSMIHRKKPWLTVENLKKLLIK